VQGLSERTLVLLVTAQADLSIVGYANVVINY
jgi:hypothetical protein